MSNIIPRIPGDDYDSKLEIPAAFRPMNCDLTITLRVTMWFEDHPTFKGQGRRPQTRPWTGQEMNAFKVNFQHDVQRFWDKRFWLVPPSDFSALDLPLDRPTHRPNIRCRFRLEVVDTPSQVRALGKTEKWHAEVRVFQIQDEEAGDWRSYERDHEDRDKGGPYNKLRLTGADALPREMEDDRIQVVAAHEVGHLLTLDHPVCPGNETRCYGETDQEKDEIMGLGNAVTPRMAKPWIDRIWQHTKTLPGKWRVMMREVPPRQMMSTSELKSLLE
jgi:hypothetical protein